MKTDPTIPPADVVGGLPWPTDPRYLVTDDGRVFSTVRGAPRELTRQQHPSGYMTVHAGQRARTVHRMVLEAFVGPCPSGAEASHLNGDRADNRLGNLAWESRSANHARKRAHGTAQQGEQATNNKLSRDQVVWARRHLRCAPRGGLAEKAAEWGVSRSTVQRAVRGATWAHLPSAEFIARTDRLCAAVGLRLEPGEVAGWERGEAGAGWWLRAAGAHHHMGQVAHWLRGAPMTAHHDTGPLGPDPLEALAAALAALETP